MNVSHKNMDVQQTGEVCLFPAEGIHRHYAAGRNIKRLSRWGILFIGLFNGKEYNGAVQ